MITPKNTKSECETFIQNDSSLCLSVCWMVVCMDCEIDLLDATIHLHRASCCAAPLPLSPLRNAHQVRVEIRIILSRHDSGEHGVR